MSVCVLWVWEGQLRECKKERGGKRRQSSRGERGGRRGKEREQKRRGRGGGLRVKV